MANHAYLRVWTRDFSVETMLAEFARFLTTARSRRHKMHLPNSLSRLWMPPRFPSLSGTCVL